ncbi:MAG: DNA-processing protein DprA [Actinomycetota bacterium]|nr:DNA-processing protein DprA [Actinomycetota bacterium]
MRVLRRDAPGWPPLLNELGPARRPELLYVQGRDIPKRPLIAVVGSRRPTIAGLDATKTLVTGLAEAGFGIVSGLAAGIDAAAHQAALGAGGYTLAVLGFGLDVDYPRRNATLKRRIASDGTLVTEYEPGTQPYQSNFPERNRIIAGLAEATLVVEGALKSGALITARLALDANRHVFAVPGSFRNVMAAGSNELIRSSQAALVTEVRHIFEELAPRLGGGDQPKLALDEPPVQLDDAEAAVLSLLDDVTVSPDRICRELRWDMGAVALALSRLDMRGLALRRGIGYQITTSGARARAAAASSSSSG